MSKIVKFSKMQATGNDFIMVDARSINLDWNELAKNICRYHLGIGADGLITINKSSKANIKMRIFNSDGSEAQISGNGLRCFAKYVIDYKIIKGPDISVETLAGTKLIQAVLTSGRVTRARVNMGQPSLKAREIPVSLDIKEPILDYPLKIAGRELKLAFVSMGNPHAVCFMEEDIERFPLAEIGPLVEHTALFPERTNFEIVNIVDNKKLKARVWERGVGETLSCGSGASATAVASRLKGVIGDHVDIMLPGGVLRLSWDGTTDVFLTGPVEEVFTGEYILWT